MPLKNCLVWVIKEADGDVKVCVKIVYDKQLIKELYNIEGEEKIKEFLWEKVKDVNRLMPEVIENAYKNAIATLRDIQKGIISLQAENDLLETSSFNPDEYRTNKNILDKLFGKQRLSEY